MNTQTLVIKEFETIAKKNKLTMAVEQKWANTGVIYFRKGWDTAASIQYDFQDTYATLQFTNGSLDRRFYIKYESSMDFKVLFAFVGIQIAKKLKPVKIQSATTKNRSTK